MNKLFIDFETYSEVDIRRHGSMQYIMCESTQVICLGYAFDDEPVELWHPGLPFPEDIKKHIRHDGKVYAHNITFDRRIWNSVLRQDFDGIPYLTVEHCVDTAALCQTYTLPASLAKAGEALAITLPKLEEGVRLINKCCRPDKKGQQPMYHENKQLFNELFMYCKRDVEAMREIVNKLPRPELIPVEQDVWCLTARMNDLGLPVDTETVSNILDYLHGYVQKTMFQVPEITSGFVNTVNQVAKIKEWCELKGVVLPDLTADTITRALEDERLPPEVTQLLKLRQELGRTSTAKFKKVNDLAYRGVVHDNLQYHGTNTGRWAGRGFQMQNLPRAKVKNPEEYIKAFNTGANIDDPVTICKALVRPMIKAPEGKLIIVSDYSSIENRILAWLAGDTVTIQGFQDNYDQYVDMASTLYNVSYDEVNKEQRQMGKIVILGCGYGMAAARFKETAKQWNIDLSVEESSRIVSIYREKYYLIKNMWSELCSTARRAIVSGKKQVFKRLTLGTFTKHDIRWLAMLLPSGKSIYYMQPSIEMHHIPGYEHMGEVPTIMHWGVNPYTKKWCKLKVSPGRLTENATQATAREVMAYGMLNVDKHMLGLDLIGTVHDEALGLINKELATQETMQEFNKHLCDIPWADDLPLKAEGYFSNRYKKD